MTVAANPLLQGDTFRRLTPTEVSLVRSLRACDAAAAQTTDRITQTDGTQIIYYSCSDLRFARIVKGSSVTEFVLNHPQTLHPTGVSAPNEATMHPQHWPQAARRIARAGVGDAATDQQNADAVAMNNALAAHGYKLADQGLYKAFQADVGLTPDGYPGTKTMQELKDVLFALGVEMANVPVYPWLASGGYDGVNAPLLSDWAPGSAPATPASNTTPTVVVTGNPPNKNALIIGGAIAAVAAGAGYMYWKKHHRRARAA